MALIPCAECGKEISTKATFCPSCGAPAAAHVPEHKATQRNVRTVQQTGKGLKAWQALFTVVLLGSVVVLAVKVGVAGEVGKTPQIGSTLFLAIGSFIALMVVKLFAWWEHG